MLNVQIQHVNVKMPSVILSEIFIDEIDVTFLEVGTFRRNKNWTVLRHC